MAKRPTPNNPDDKIAADDTGKEADAAATLSAAPTLSAADVVKLLRGTTVRAPKTDKTGKTEVVDRRIVAADILSFRLDGDTVWAVTIDGRKHQVGAGE